LIALQLQRQDVEGVDAPLREYYWITKLTHGREGVLALELEHCPVDDRNRSLVARDVAAVTVQNVVLLTGDSAPNCDADPSRATDCSIPAPDEESWTEQEVWTYGRFGRRPIPGEYLGNGYRSGGGGAAGATGGSGGGGAGGGGPAAPLPPTGPVEPPGIPSRPGTPAPLPPQPPVNYTKYVLLLTFIGIAPWTNYGIYIQQVDIPISPGQTAYVDDGTNEQVTYVRIVNADGTLGARNEYQHLVNGSVQQTWGYEWKSRSLSPVGPV